jgi:hypothetical protein
MKHIIVTDGVVEEKTLTSQEQAEYLASLEAQKSADQAAFDALPYSTKRELSYPTWGEQLDYIYHNGVDAWKTNIVDPIKAKYPKPEGA